MKKRILTSILSLFFALAIFTVSGCDTVSLSESAYWFSTSNSYFVSYNEENNNLDKAGTYWEFTVANNVDISLNLRMNVDNFSSYAYLYVNDKQVKSEDNTGIYTYVYNLSLKKGDKIKIHAKWLYGLSANDEGFDIQMMTITYYGEQYIIKEFDKSTTN
jgi:hypothetical protein